MKFFQQKFYFSLCCFLLLGAGMLSAQRQITGQVTDAETGEALIGASVVVEGTAVGAATDFEGNYRLNVPANATTIRISYTGYETQNMTLGASNVLDVRLKVAGALEEVVVIGYGTVKREDLTGSVQAVGTKDFNKGAITAPQELLMGKIAGVQVTTGADPGGGATIRIRGGSSLSATNDPLIVIDGIPIANDDVSGSRNPLNLINPNDVETMTVLKDASATAIYGSRASNGVILITTKKGSAANRELRFTYTGNLAFSQIIQKSEVLSGDEYRNLIREQFDDNHPARTLLGDANTDWQSEIYRTGVTHDHNLAITGAVGSIPFRASWGATDRSGILKTDRFKRVTAGINLNPGFLKNMLQFNVGLKLVSDRNRFGNRDAIGAATQIDPTQPIFAADSTYGEYFSWRNNDGTPNTLAPANPLALLYMRDDESHVGRYIASGAVDYRFWFLPELRANLNVSYDYTHGQGTIFVPQNAPFSRNDGGGRSEEYFQKRKDKLLEFYLNYAKTIGAVKFDVMGGYSWQNFFRNNYSIATNAVGSTIIKPEDENPREYFLLSLFSRANVSYNDRIFLTASVRRDGTSRFPNNKWGLFPAAALAFKVVDRENATFSGLKLRLGFGVTGQQDISADFYPALARYTYSFTNAQYQFGDQFYNTLRPQGYDADLKWEETTTYNAAIDYGFWGNRVTGSLEFYLRETKDLINFIPVPAGTNLTNFITTNVGDLENRGVEFSINALPWKSSQASWSIGFNVAANRNKITRLTATEDPNYQGVATGGIAGGVGNNIQIHSVGYPASSFFVYEQVYDANGVPVEGIYVDRNGDGSITPDDRYRFEKPAPDYLIGFNTGLYFGKFDLTLAGRSNIGNYMYNNNLSNNAYYNQLYGSTGVLRNVLSTTREIDFNVPQYFSDHYVVDASFLRIDHITAGYTFSKLGRNIQALRLSVTVQNPLLVTKYDGLDPEVFNGIDNNVYPRSRTYLLGVKADF
ncbi:MAG: SusC/RagA family TonB-linked outer membrane protein [Saprospiraceae bacterium]|nr:SusC/RagA family TonB-linked outer membrane protein [Saprospiraceae bacterium]